MKPTFAVACLALVVAACPRPAPPPDPPVPQQTPDRPAGVSLEIVSVASDPPAGDGARWDFPSGQPAFSVIVTLRGRMTASVKAELFATDGRALGSLDRTVEVDGTEVLDLGEFAMPDQDGFRLVVEAVGPGVSARQEISVTRGRTVTGRRG